MHIPYDKRGPNIQEHEPNAKINRKGVLEYLNIGVNMKHRHRVSYLYVNLTILGNSLIKSNKSVHINFD